MQTDATSHTIVGPYNVGSCWHLLALVACCMQTNATTANIVGVRSLFGLNNSSFCPKLFLSVYRPSHAVFSSNNSLYLTRARGKSFPRGQSAALILGLTIFWCIYSRFSIFCLNVSCFLKLFAQLSLIRHVYNNPERRKRATIVCFYQKNILQGACADVSKRPTLMGFHANGCNIRLRNASPVTEQ